MPYTGIVLAFVAAAAAIYLILLCHWLVAAGLFPRMVSSFEQEYGRRPVRATLLGLVTFGPLLLLFINSGAIGHPAARLVALIAGAGALLAAFLGSAGLALRIGNGLSPDATLWQRMMRGGSMLSLCFITPLIGTFFMLPIGLCSGFGVFLLSKPWKTESTDLAVDAAPEPAHSL